MYHHHKMAILNTICDKMLLRQGLTAPVTQSWDATNPKGSEPGASVCASGGTVASPNAQASKTLVAGLFLSLPPSLTKNPNLKLNSRYSVVNSKLWVQIPTYPLAA